MQGRGAKPGSLLIYTGFVLVNWLKSIFTYIYPFFMFLRINGAGPTEFILLATSLWLLLAAHQCLSITQKWLRPVSMWKFISFLYLFRTNVTHWSTEPKEWKRFRIFSPGDKWTHAGDRIERRKPIRQIRPIVWSNCRHLGFLSTFFLFKAPSLRPTILIFIAPLSATGHIHVRCSLLLRHWQKSMKSYERQKRNALQ